MLKIADLILGGKIVPLPGEFDRVARVFSKAGGSWKSLFQGSVEDVELLKTVFKMAFKHGYLTKKEKWA
jgi:hypothetical protein